MHCKFCHIAFAIVLLAMPAISGPKAAAAEDLKPPATATNPKATGAKDGAQNTRQTAREPIRQDQPKLTEDKFNDWSMQCIVNSPAAPPCQIIYRLMSPDHKQVALVLSLALYSKSSTRLQMALPLGFSIPRGVRITFGQNFALTAQVSRCTIQGCLIEGEGQAKMIDAMLKAKSGSASVYNMQGSQIRLPISLDGFSAAYEMLRKKAG